MRRVCTCGVSEQSGTSGRARGEDAANVMYMYIGTPSANSQVKLRR